MTKSTGDSVRAFYDEFAPEYERSRTATAYSRLLANLDRGFIFASVLDGTALELGPGTGRVTERLLERGLDVTAVDASPGMLEQLAARLPGITRHVLPANALDQLPGYGAFDNAVACRVLPHVEDWEAALALLAGAVRPGGRVIFDLWSARGYVALGRRLGLRRERVFTRFVAPAAMLRAIERAGLTIVRRRGVGFGPLPPYWLEALGATRLGRLAHIQLFCCEVAGA